MKLTQCITEKKSCSVLHIMLKRHEAIFLYTELSILNKKLLGGLVFIYKYDIGKEII